MLAPLFLACSILLAGPVQKDSDVVEFVIQSERADQTFLRIETPLYTGQFDITVERSDELGTVTIFLEGTIDRGLGAEKSLDADLRFTYSINQNDVERVGNGRLVRGDGGGAELFKAEKLAPNAFEWSNAKHPALGYIQVWNIDNPDEQLTDSIIISLYHDMIGVDGDVGIQGSECVPTFDICLRSSEATCLPNRVGSFSYSCNSGVVSCSFTCLQSPPS